MATGGSSYWSIRRRVRRNLEEHFSEIENLSRPEIEETLIGNSSQQQTSNTQLSHVDDNVNRVDQDAENLEFGELSENEDGNSNDHVDFENNMGIASDSSDKDSESESENNQYDQESFKEDLRNWAVTHQVPNSSISDLLSILRKQHAYLIT